MNLIEVIDIHGQLVLCDPALLEAALNKQGYTRNGGFAAKMAATLADKGKKMRGCQKEYYAQRKKGVKTAYTDQVLKESIELEKQFDELLERVTKGLSQIGTYEQQL